MLELRGEYSRLFMEEAVRIAGTFIDTLDDNSYKDGADVMANVLFRM